MRSRPAPATATSDALAAASTFRVGRRRVVATGAEALGRWAIQQGILPRAEGGTQRPPAERLAALMADPACALPLAALTPDELVALRARRRAALGSEDAMLVEQAALAAAISLLCELQGLHWPHPLAAPASDGIGLVAAESVAALAAKGLEPALACGARFDELEACSIDTDDGGRCWVLLPGRAVQLAAECRADPLAVRGLRTVAARAGLVEGSLRLTGLADRLGRGSHLDEAFLMAGCGAAGVPSVRIPWLG